MKSKSILFSLFAAALVLFSSCCESKYAVVPQPESIKGSCFGYKVSSVIKASAADEALKSVALTWGEMLVKTHKTPGVDSTAANHVRITSDVQLPTVEWVENVADADLVLAVDTTLAADCYQLKVSCKGICVKGGAPQAIFWGLQSLTQILLQEEADAEGARKLDGVSIVDSPKFAHRGALLDCCRHFFSVEEVKEFIDMLALNKMNIFHWHLTEDQGWRIEIKKYPRLTSIGSVRAQTVVGRHQKNPADNVYDGVQYGPYFYSQEEAKEIVAYAAARFVTVVPEIEIPGHNLAAITSYPYLSCKNKSFGVWCHWGVSKEGVVCASKETTYEFFQDVLDEICEIFPSEYIHIGGDEAPRDMWKACPSCQKLMKKNGYESEAQLQTYVLQRIEKYLNDKGRKIIGWDEVLEGGVTPSATVMAWRGPKYGIQAAKQGNDVIMTPKTHCYLDYHHTVNPDKYKENLGTYKHYLPLQQCFDFDPFDELNEEECKSIKGLQGNIWCEFIKTFDHVQFMTLPRLAALAEVAWCKNKTTYDCFHARMEKAMIPAYQYHGYVYAPYAFDGTEKYKFPHEEFVRPL